jgi:hypothetical protein
MQLEGLGKSKEFTPSGLETPRDLPACSIVPQPTMLPLLSNSNFAVKWRSFGQYSSLADQGHGVCLFVFVRLHHGFLVEMEFVIIEIICRIAWNILEQGAVGFEARTFAI